MNREQLVSKPNCNILIILHSCSVRPVATALKLWSIQFTFRFIQLTMHRNCRNQNYPAVVKEPVMSTLLPCVIIRVCSIRADRETRCQSACIIILLERYSTTWLPRTYCGQNTLQQAVEFHTTHPHSIMHKIAPRKRATWRRVGEASFRTSPPTSQTAISEQVHGVGVFPLFVVAQLFCMRFCISATTNGCEPHWYDNYLLPLRVWTKECDTPTKDCASRNPLAILHFF